MSTPQSIAIIGASTNRSKYGNAAVRTYKDRGWTVYPVNPNHADIEGLPAFASVRDVPQPVHRVSVYLPPSVLLDILDDIAAVHPDEVWLNPGSESKDVLDKAESLGLNIIRACSIVDQGASPTEYMS